MNKSTELASRISPAMPEVTNVYDAMVGLYADKVAAMGDTAMKLGTAALPMAADPSPFAIMGAGSGQR
jgi:hypothetical protein